MLNTSNFTNPVNSNIFYFFGERRAWQKSPVSLRKTFNFETWCIVETVWTLWNVNDNAFLNCWAYLLIQQTLYMNTFISLFSKRVCFPQCCLHIVKGSDIRSQVVTRRLRSGVDWKALSCPLMIGSVGTEGKTKHGQFPSFRTHLSSFSPKCQLRLVH